MIRSPQSKFQILLFGIAAAVLLFYAAIFAVSPLNGEDYALTRQFHGFDVAHRLGWIAYRSYVQVTTWNARLGEQLAIFWLGMPPLLYLCVAVVTFVLFNVLMGGLLSGRAFWAQKTALSIAVVMALWPGMEVFFWRTANAAYLQPMLLTLLCLWCYADPVRLKATVARASRLALLCVAAFLVGLSFENVPLAILPYMLLAIWLMGEPQQRLRAGLPPMALLAGWALLITAPSTAIRRAFYGQAYGIHGISFDYLLSRASDVSLVFLTSSALLAAVAALCWVWLIWRSPGQRWQLLLPQLPAWLVVASVVMAPYTEPRAFLLAWVIWMAGVVEVLFRLQQRFVAVRVVLIPALAMCLVFPLYALRYYQDFNARVTARNQDIQRRAAGPACQQGINVPLISTVYPYRYLNNRDDWTRSAPQFMARYYGCKVVVQ